MVEIPPVARWLILLGLGLVAVGGALWMLNRIGLQVGNLPGDFRFSIGEVGCFIPLTTSILASLVLTVLLSLISRLLNR